MRKKPKKSKSADTKGKKPGGQSSVVQEEVNEGVPIDALIFEFLQTQLGALGLQTNRHMTVVSAPNAQPTTMMGSVANAIGMGTTSSSLSPAAAASSTLTADKKKSSKSASSEVRSSFLFPSLIRIIEAAVLIGGVRKPNNRL